MITIAAELNIVAQLPFFLTWFTTGIGEFASLIFFSILFSISMFTIAAELNIVAELPFFLTWFTTGVGEFASLIIGAIIIGKIGRRIDLSK